jgi:hypothetical protein
MAKLARALEGPASALEEAVETLGPFPGIAGERPEVKFAAPFVDSFDGDGKN